MSGLRERAANQAGNPPGTDVVMSNVELNSKLAAMERSFQAAMPRGADAAQLVRDIATCVRNNPKLLQSDFGSLAAGAMVCAQLGLRPGVGALGHAYLLPFRGYDPVAKTKRTMTQVVIGYQGMLELAYRHPRVLRVSAYAVHANDEFSVSYGLRPDLQHVPCLTGDRGPATGYYAVSELRDASPSFVYMTRAEVEAHRDKFAMQRDFRTQEIKGPWADHFDSMAMKTVLRKLFKTVPRSTELVAALAADETYRVSPTAEAVKVVALPPDEPAAAPTAPEPVGPAPTDTADPWGPPPEGDDIPPFGADPVTGELPN